MKDTSLVVLIDAENSEAKIVEGLFAEIAKYGIANVKRIYGNWEKPPQGWTMEILLRHAITPIQVYPYAKGKDGTGKNSADHAMHIDAMDLLYTQKFDGFCLVTSDSDYTRLANRLRESQIIVYGFGRKNTPISFINACDKFIYTDILRENRNEEPLSTQSTAIETPKETNTLKSNTTLMNILREAIDAVSNEEGWAHLGGMGTHISKQYPSFDSRNYGYSKLSELIKQIDIFEIKEFAFKGTNHLYVRNKRKKKA